MSTKTDNVEKADEEQVDPAWTVPEQMTPLLVPIDQPKPHPDNPNRGDIKSITDSLRTFGQYKPIVMQRSSGYIIAGNHTWQGLRKLGASHVAAVQVDVDDDTAVRIMLADNRTGRLGKDDDQALADLLSGLVESYGGEENLLGTGYDAEDLSKLLDKLDDSPDEDSPEPSPWVDRWEIVVECVSEAHQEEVFELLKAQGYTCRVLSL